MRRSAGLMVALALAATPGEARTIRHADRELAFEYGWPAFRPPLPRLEARLAADAARLGDSFHRNAVETRRRDRSESGEDPPRHDFEKSWTVVGRSARLLSLSAGSQFYTGGAHGGIAYDALLWDRKTDRPLTLRALFMRPGDALAQMEKAYCRRLRQDQTERRGEGFAEADFRCPRLAAAPVVLTGTGKIDGFEVLLEPYAAGSWAEGPYEVEVRFTPAVLRLVKPEFRKEFGA